MKKTILLLAGAIAIFACTKENESVEPGRVVVKEFTAGVEPATKTTLSDKSVLWSSDDQIGVFPAAGSASVFSVKSIASDNTTAVFSGAVTGSTTYYAVYPYSADFALTSAGYITAAIPTTQTFTDGSFSSGANLAVAMTTDDSMSFKTVGAILGVTVTASDIKTIVFTSDAVVAGGTATINYNSGDPTITSISGGSNSITMSGDFVSGKTYYFAVYPGTYNYFTLTFTTSAGKTTTMTNSTALKIARKDNINLGSLSLSLTPTFTATGTSTFVGSTITYTANDLGTDAEYSWTFSDSTSLRTLS